MVVVVYVCRPTAQSKMVLVTLPTELNLTACVKQAGRGSMDDASSQITLQKLPWLPSWTPLLLCGKLADMVKASI